jgi:hypothetical protein
VQTSDLNSSQTASIFCHFNSSSSATLASSLAATANTAVSAALNSTLDAHQGGTLNLGCGIIFYTIRSPVRAWQALKLFAKQKRQRKQ